MKRIDIQVNGGSGLLFNDITNIEEFLKIELNHLKYGKSFIIPTFITDSYEKMGKFVDILLQRISLNEKEYKINDNIIILPKLWGIHIEGPFITNKGTHPKEFLKDFNEKNINDIINILKPLGNLPIIITIAPELLLENIEDNKKLIKKLKKELNITISAGHTKITKEDFKKIQDILEEDKFLMLTHFHNAMLEGHFRGNIDGIPSYLMENYFNGYFGFITDGQHTSSGELIPTLLNYYDKICIISDCASPANCIVDKTNNLFKMGGSIGVVEQKENELPSFFWTDFSKTDNEKIKNKQLSEKELYNLYIKGQGGYKTLAGSAVNLNQCYSFLKNFNIEEELNKSKNNPKTKLLLEKGLQKNNITESEIKSFLNKIIEKMFFENQLKAINLEKDIIEYEIIDNKLYKNNKLYIDFDCNFGDFLKQNIPDQTLLKEELINDIRKIFC